ncbi:MAG: division/cell wall cluster transcriptional repressor MraZ [Gammaproteobacteria bacterium]
MFSGNSSLNLDSKARLAIPSRYREHLNEVCAGELKIAPSPYDRCLWIYPIKEWEVIAKKLTALPDANKNNRRIKQKVIGDAETCNMDSLGRVRLSTKLVGHADLKKEIVIRGQGNKFELWDEAIWTTEEEEWMQNLEDGDQEISESLSNISF